MSPSTRTALSSRTALAVLVALVLSVGSVVLPASAHAAEAVSGQLGWGVKESFRSYITGPSANGSVETSDGASTADGSGYAFALSAADYDVDTGSLTASFSGTVRFTGHDGQLDLTISDPSVAIADGTGTLSATMSSRALSGGEAVDYGTVVLANLSAPSGASVDGEALTWSGITATMAATGVEAFAGFYPEGTALDPLAISLTGDWAGTPEPTTTTLAASPATGATVGDEVTLTATVAPAVDGTVSFANGGAEIGTASVASGTATLTTSALPAGTLSLTAVFTPASADHAASTGKLSYTVGEQAEIPADSSMSWGLRDTWRSYITGTIANGSAKAVSPASIASGNIVQWSEGKGTLDAETLTGSVSFSGGVRYTGHAGELDLTLTNPTLTLTSSTKATLSFDVTSKGYSGFPETNAKQMAFATFTLGSATIANGLASWSGATGVFTAEAKKVFGGQYDSNPYTDPLTLALPLDGDVDQTATTTTLKSSTTSITAGDAVTLTAAVSPKAASGTVQFRNGGTLVGSAKLSSGSASLTTKGLAEGTAKVTATFVPTTTAYAGSTSKAVSITVAAKAPATSTPTEITEGSLTWGVKQSFRAYITGSIAKGSISVAGGATTQNGAYWFGQSSTSWSASSGTGSTSYAGSVRFLGHAGILDLTFSNPTVSIDSAGSGTLTVSVNDTRVAMGSLNLAAATRTEVSGGVSYQNVPVTLTSAGAGVFSYGSSQFYAAGTAMDSLSFTVGAAATSAPAATGTTTAAYEETSWTAPAEPPANTGLYIDPEQLKDIRPGSEITVVGEGFGSGEEDIKVVLYSDPVVLEEHLDADADGTATWTGIIPLDTEPGEHTLTFQGEETNLGIVIDVKEAEEVEGCTVESASLDWGFKESFRSYISGSIANGDWTVADGATYETPAFGWTDAEGGFDSEAFTGQVSFTGSVRFTGHDGLLDTTIANPTLLFTGPDTAYLLLDVTGVTMDDALSGNVDNVQVDEQISFVELDLSAGSVEVSEDGTTITATEVPTAITSQGYAAFPNYEAGTEFDPVSFTITTATDCSVAAAAPADDGESAEADASADTAAPTASDADSSWLLWAGAGLVAAGVIAALAIWIVRSRRASAVPAASGPAEGDAFDDMLNGGAR